MKGLIVKKHKTIHQSQFDSFANFEVVLLNIFTLDATFISDEDVKNEYVFKKSTLLVVTIISSGG
jgi:hypothetical protein